MKKTIFLGMCLLGFFVNFAFATPTNQNQLDHIDPAIAETFNVNSVDDFLNLTPKKYKEITGERMSIKEVIGLKIAQRKVKKAIDSGSMPFDTDDNEILIYVLCFFIPPLAVGLLYDIGSEFWTNVILTLLCGIPGIIHAFIVCARYFR